MGIRRGPDKTKTSSRTTRGGRKVTKTKEVYTQGPGRKVVKTKTKVGPKGTKVKDVTRTNLKRTATVGKKKR